MSVTERLGGWLADRSSRRSFLAKSTMAATALSVAPMELLLKPGTAYAQICQCTPVNDCDCSDLCCSGYTQFCCTINNGVNACPQGTFAGGWWLADGSEYCAGPRYYIDCQGECQCGCDGGSFCPSCDGLTCECAEGTCSNWYVGCNEFRYGQCNMQIGCSGRIACRVVSCTPPWVIDSTCTTVVQVDDSTADAYAPCQGGPTTPPVAATVVAMAATPTSNGYWITNDLGDVQAFGGAQPLGTLSGITLNKPIVGMAVTPSGGGYWLVAADGGIFQFGDAHFYGSTGNIALNKPITAMTADPATGGYQMVATDGGVFTFNAPFFGSTGDIRLNAPIVGLASTPSGHGYWLVGTDGGIFEFGDAAFYGSLGNIALNKPIVGMAATPSGHGYWLVAADGGIFEFGDAAFYGSLGNITLNKPIVGMAATKSGGGYWLVAADGGIFEFGDAHFYGSGA
jgi:hypothetical protein